MNGDELRGKVAWHMSVEDVSIGHLIGFDYPMDGDARPAVKVAS